MFKAGEEKQVIEFLKLKLFSDVKEVVRKLTIIDPYFFSNSRFAFTRSRLIEILTAGPPSLQWLEVVTSEKSFDKTSAASLTKSLPPHIRLTVIKNGEFHDRFWIINDSKGIVVGTSINGFGNKHFFIQDDFLSTRDVQRILSFYQNTKTAV